MKVYIYKNIDLFATASSEKVFFSKKEALDYYNENKYLNGTKTEVEMLVCVEVDNDYVNDWEFLKKLDVHERSYTISGYELLNQATKYTVLRKRFA